MAKKPTKIQTGEQTVYGHEKRAAASGVAQTSEFAKRKGASATRSAQTHKYLYVYRSGLVLLAKSGIDWKLWRPRTIQVDKWPIRSGVEKHDDCYGANEIMQRF